MLDWKIPVAAGVVGLVLGAGAVYLWKDAEISAMRADEADAVALAQTNARKLLEDRIEAVATVDEANRKLEWAAYGGLQNERVKIADLRASVASGATSLRVRADCPAPAAGNVPATGTAAGVGAGTWAGLAADARQDYFALIEAIELEKKKLQVLQNWSYQASGGKTP